ncbi:MAG: hypothetical protein HOM69_06830 [Gammaproteobacteria bacterium]|jgi:starvation-inducible outer membrane lipoprotein|nr:hypothetical protein [Gammaproteobacteria bacterium]MBT5052922.1 hypothetical protein [Gammaproteobacteria bacterium]
MIRVWVFLWLLTGCASTPEPVPEPRPDAPSTLSRASVMDGNLAGLNLSLTPFSHLGRSVSPVRAELLAAEQRYLPYLLKTTLTESGFWGAVRVTPSIDVTAELNCQGQLLSASAAELQVQLICRDALGKLWLDDRFDTRIAPDAYLQAGVDGRDPYRPVMVRIANRLADGLASFTDEDRRRLRDAALLRYAQTLSPEGFDGYLAVDAEGLMQVQGLPASSDPMVARVQRIRDSEYQFIDAMDEQYRLIYQQMIVPYRVWRQYQYEFEDYNTSLGDRSVGAQRRAAASYEVMLSTYKRYQDYKRNEDELSQMARSLAQTLSPTLGRIEGQVVELTGNLEQQYELWRSYLLRLYEAETSPLAPE